MRKSSGPLNMSEAVALLRDKGALKQLLAAPETKQLLEMLSAKDTGQLRNAAEQAKRGDPTAIQSVAQDILKRPEGAALLRQLERTLPGKNT